MSNPAYAVPSGTLHNLGELAYQHRLPKRHHRFTMTGRGKTCYILRQVRTDYGGAFYCVLPITGDDPAAGGMLWMGWLSVREEEIPRLKRAARRVPEETAQRVRRNIEDREAVFK